MLMNATNVFMEHFPNFLLTGRFLEATQPCNFNANETMNRKSGTWPTTPSVTWLLSLVHEVILEVPINKNPHCDISGRKRQQADLRSHGVDIRANWKTTAAVMQHTESASHAVTRSGVMSRGNVSSRCKNWQTNNMLRPAIIGVMKST